MYVPYDSFHIYIHPPEKTNGWKELEPAGSGSPLFFTSTNLQFFPALTQVGDFKATKIFRTLRHSRAVVGDFATEKSGEIWRMTAAAVVQQVGEFHVN